MLDILAMSFGIIGCFILASEKQFERKELLIFTFFIIANVLFLIYGIAVKSIGIIGGNIAYLFSSVKGLRKNLTDDLEVKKNTSLI